MMGKLFFVIFVWQSTLNYCVNKRRFFCERTLAVKGSIFDWTHSVNLRNIYVQFRPKKSLSIGEMWTLQPQNDEQAKLLGSLLIQSLGLTTGGIWVSLVSNTYGVYVDCTCM